MVKRHLAISPSKRKSTIALKPDSAAAQFPLSEYLIPPSDARGHSISTSIGLAPNMHRMAQIVMREDSLPFDTAQDIFRWCIHHGLKVLVDASQNPDVRTDWSNLISWSRTASMEQEMILYERHLEKIVETITRLGRAGHYEKAIQLADVIWGQSDKLDDPYWKKVYRNKARVARSEIVSEMKRKGLSKEEIAELADHAKEGIPEEDRPVSVRDVRATVRRRSPMPPKKS